MRWAWPSAMRIAVSGWLRYPHWHPDSRETADHSVPYCVATTLLDGSVTPNSFDAAHLSSPVLRKVLDVMALEENTSFTHAYEKHPVEYRCRVNVRLRNGEMVWVIEPSAPNTPAKHNQEREHIDG